MIVRIGEKIAFGGEEFVVVKVVRDDNVECKTLYVTAYDPATADKEQQKQIKTEQVQENVVDVLNRLLKKGGEGGMGIGGINFGG